MGEVWDPNWFGSTKTLDMHVSWLRRKLGDEPAQDRHRARRRLPLRALMRRRLVVTTPLIALAAVLVLGVPLGIVESRRVRSDENARLEREADEIAGAIDDRIERDRGFRAADLAPFVPSGHRAVVVYRGRPDRGRATDCRRHAQRALRRGPGRDVTVIAPAGDVARRRRAVWRLSALLALPPAPRPPPGWRGSRRAASRARWSG